MLATDDEFMYVLRNSADVADVVHVIPRVLLSQTSRNFIASENNPDASGHNNHDYAGASASINAAGTQLTLALVLNGVTSGRYTLQSVLAR